MTLSPIVTTSLVDRAGLDRARVGQLPSDLRRIAFVRPSRALRIVGDLEPCGYFLLL